MERLGESRACRQGEREQVEGKVTKPAGRDILANKFSREVLESSGRRSPPGGSGTKNRDRSKKV